MRAATSKAYHFIKRDEVIPTPVLIKRARRVFKQRKRRELGVKMSAVRDELNKAIHDVEVFIIDKSDRDVVIAQSLEDCSDDAVDLYFRGGINPTQPKRNNRHARRRAAAAARRRGVPRGDKEMSEAAEHDMSEEQWNELMEEYRSENPESGL